MNPPPGISDIKYANEQWLEAQRDIVEILDNAQTEIERILTVFKIKGDARKRFGRWRNIDPLARIDTAKADIRLLEYREGGTTSLIKATIRTALKTLHFDELEERDDNAETAVFKAMDSAFWDAHDRVILLVEHFEEHVASAKGHGDAGAHGDVVKRLTARLRRALEQRDEARAAAL